MKQNMQQSFFSFALSKLLPGALLLNFLINLLVGWLVYGHRAHMPIWGASSILVDTIIGVFLIFAITYWTVAPVARREANSGRISGYGKVGLYAWAESSPGWATLSFALVGTVVLFAAVYGASSLWFASGLQGSTFLWFKAALSGFSGALASYVSGWFAIQSASQPYDDPRWCTEPDAPVEGITYPCDYVDKGAIGVTNKNNGCSGTPTWQCVITGTIEEEHVRTALSDTLQRYPSLTTVIQSLDGHPEFASKFRYVTDPSHTVDRIFDSVDLRGHDASAFQELLQERLNRHTDQFVDPPMTLTFVQLKDDEYRLLFRQHHGIADGRAFIELLVDFSLYLNAAIEGRRPSNEELAPIHRKPELEALGLEKKEQEALTLAGLIGFMRSRIHNWLHPATHLLQNHSNDYRGGNGTLHWVVDDTALEAWRPVRKQMGASLNSVLAASIFEANRRWHAEMGRDVGRTVGTMVMETRPRDGSFRSFANHLATLEVELDLTSEQTAEDFARSIQSQVVAQRDAKTPIKRLLIEQKLVEALSMDQLQSHIFKSGRADANVNFSNLIPLSIPTMEGAHWKMEEILITTPITPRNGIIFTVIRYNGKIIFNINYKESAATREEAQRLLEHFTNVVKELLKYEPVELPTQAIAVPPLEIPQQESKSGWQRFAWRDLLAHPRLGVYLAGLAIFLTLSTLSIGIVLDDQLQWLVVDGHSSPHLSGARPLDLFHFISDSNRDALVKSGSYPWWSAPKLQLAFFRPLSSLTHWLDYTYVRNFPFLMHAHSLLWLALLIWMITLLYRRMLSSAWLGGLAALLYAVDEAHGLAIGFLANRNALIATTLAVATLIVHDKWRREQKAGFAFLAPLVLALGMLSAEFALFATAYLFAYALFLDPAKSLWKRLLTLVPYGVVVVAWRIGYNFLGYGSFQSGAYIDPVGEPIRFFLAVSERLPTLMLAQWTPMSADFWMTNSHTYNIGHAIFGACILSVIAWILIPLLKKDAVARFWALGMFLACLPICATFPHDRILFGIGVGAMGLIAQFLGLRFAATPQKGEVPDPRAEPMLLRVRVLAGFFLVAHLCFAPIFLPLKALAPFFLERLEARSFASLPKDKTIQKKKILLVQTPGFLSHTMYAMYALKRMPQPELLRQLSITLKSVRVTRLDRQTLRLQASDVLVDRSTRFLVRSTSMPFRVGQRFVLPDVTVTVRKLGSNGHPATADFHFKKNLEDSEYRWMTWRGKGFVPFKLPQVGTTKVLKEIPPTSVFF